MTNTPFDPFAGVPNVPPMSPGQAAAPPPPAPGSIPVSVPFSDPVSDPFAGSADQPPAPVFDEPSEPAAKPRRSVPKLPRGTRRDPGAPKKSPKPPKDSSARSLPQLRRRTGPSNDHQWPSPRKPSALLVPRYIIEKRALSRTKRRVMVALPVALGVIALVVTSVFLLKQMSATNLEERQAELAVATTEMASLQPVADYYTGFQVRQERISGLLALDVAQGKLARHTIRLGRDAKITAYETKSEGPCAGPDPFVSTTAIGCITVIGQTSGVNQVASFVAALNSDKDEILSDAFVSYLKHKGNGVYEFNVSANYQPPALSGKYADLVATATPTPTPTATPTATPAPDDADTTEGVEPTAPSSTEVTP